MLAISFSLSPFLMYVFALGVEHVPRYIKHTFFNRQDSCILHSPLKALRACTLTWLLHGIRDVQSFPGGLVTRGAPSSRKALAIGEVPGDPVQNL